MKYRKKPVEIEAITFEEFVEYGRIHGESWGPNGMPWHFKYNGHPITHENDECYLIPTLEGTMRFTPEDMLITGVNGEIYPCKIDIFEKTYDVVGEENDKQLDQKGLTEYMLNSLPENFDKSKASGNRIFIDAIAGGIFEALRKDVKDVCPTINITSNESPEKIANMIMERLKKESLTFRSAGVTVRP